MFKKCTWIFVMSLASIGVEANILFPASKQPSVSEQTAQPINYQSIKRLIDSDQLVKAKQDAINYLQKNPKDGDVRLLLAIILLREKNYADSSKQAVFILNQTPRYEDARMVLINNLLSTGNYIEARRQAMEGLKLSPKSTQLKQKLFQINQMIKNSQSKPVTSVSYIAPIEDTQAQVAVNKSSPAQPATTNVTTYQSIQKLKNAGQLQEAKTEALNHLKQYPNDVDVMLILGNIYYQEKNFSASEKMAIAVLQRKPDYTDARILLISNKWATQQLVVALNEIETGLKYAPKNTDLQNFQKKILVSMKQQEEAQKKNIRLL